MLFAINNLELNTFSVKCTASMKIHCVHIGCNTIKVILEESTLKNPTFPVWLSGIMGSQIILKFSSSIAHFKGMDFSWKAIMSSFPISP